jgi:perosamine synthetase
LPWPCTAVGSGTDALHLSYLLAGIEEGDEVLAPVFTCAATNMPLRYIGANIRFVDADPKLQFFQPNCLNDLRSAAPTRSVC